jgi:ParB/RepB/Spo0J family partition protein
MKLQSGASLVSIDSIKVLRDERHRREIKTEDLERSISKRGLLNPIIISDTGELKAGERRLTACKNLGMAKILARKVSDLSPVEAQIIELEENIKRSDLEWQELAKALARIHDLYTLEDPSWTLENTADECAITKGTVSLYLSVHAEMGNERVAKATTVREAYNLLARRSQRNAGLALQELLDGPDASQAPALSPADEKEAQALIELGQPLPPRLLVAKAPQVEKVPDPEVIVEASFLDWAPRYRGPKFNLIHCDFPYGIDFAKGPQGRSGEISSLYQDTPDVYQALLYCLCNNLDKIMSVSSHLMFWLSADTKIMGETLAIFSRLAPSLSFHKFPLIWHKSDNAGIASDPRHGPRHVYEVCLLATRGQRQIAKIKSDTYAAPTDKKLHPSAKPEPMLRHFMEMLVDDTTSLLDPTCGSASSLRAADSLGATRVLGLEMDPQYLAPARSAFKQARLLRDASTKAIDL